METTRITSQFHGQNYTTKISNQKHQIITDEPREDGGQDKGFNPFELILGGLATCTTATIKIYADRKNWLINSIEIDLNMQEIEKQQIISTNITVNGDISEEQKKRLLIIAQKCPVHKMLSNSNQINTKLF